MQSPTLNDSITLRQFQDLDMARVKEIANSSSREVTQVESILRFYNVSPEGFIVAEYDGKIAGFLLTNEREMAKGNKECHLLDIATDPSFRGRGIGKALIDYLEEMMKKKGIERIGLEVKTNNDAQNFYLKLEFVASHVIKSYYRMRGYSEDALIMYKEI